MGEKLYLGYSRRLFKCKRCIEEELSQEVRNKKAREIFVDYYNSPIELSPIQKAVDEFTRKFVTPSQNEKERVLNEGKKLIQDKQERILNESKKLSQSERERIERILNENEKFEEELYEKIEKSFQAEGENNRASENSKELSQTEKEIYTLELGLQGLTMSIKT